MKPALLVIDVQRRFFKKSPAVAASLHQAIEYINAAIALFRKKELPIIVVQHQEEETGLIPGTEDFEVAPELDLLPADPRIVKTYGNAFNRTDLAAQLRALGVDTLILTGFAAEYCVFSTCRGAEDLDFRPIIMQGSLAALAQEHIRFVEEVNEVVSYGALSAFLS